MNVTSLIASLDHFSQILPALLTHISDEHARWKPPEGNWSILEVLCHLADEEVEDFRQRLKLVLMDPEAPWPAIRPEEAARERNYNRQDVRATLDRFLRERADSLAWLRGLDKPDWNAVHEHPQFGPLRAGDLLSSWAAHDWLHLRQIAKRRFELVQADAQPFQTKYAGSWTARPSLGTIDVHGIPGPTDEYPPSRARPLDRRAASAARTVGPAFQRRRRSGPRADG